jgi:di/tricarboxylate transporter
VEIAFVLGLLVLAVVLFATEALSVDLITLILLIALVVSGVLEPAEAFAGFSNELLIILASIFVLSGALQLTGVMDQLGRGLARFGGDKPNRTLLALMSAVAAVSAFMNNTTATAIFVPPALGIARQSRLSPSKLLMPLAFASVLGGTLTLVGTSTNIAVSGYIARAGMQPLGLFEATPVGLAIVAVGIAYMLLIGQRLLPDRGGVEGGDRFQIREYLSEIVVPPGSALIGQSVFGSDLAGMGFRIVEVIRARRAFLPQADTLIESLDVLLVQGRLADLLKVKETAGIEILPDIKHGDLELPADDVRVAEVLVSPRSELLGGTLKEARFRQRYGLVVLAFYREGQSLREKLGKIRFRLGDLLLVQGNSERIEALGQDPGFWVIEQFQPRPYRRHKGLLTLALFGGALLVGGAGWVPLSIAFLAAAVLTLVTRCITAEEAYGFVDWRLLILIGGMTAFGVAMEKSGAARFLATQIVAWLAPYGDLVVLAGFAVLTVLLTQPMSNAAAALVVLPVAIDAARQLGANERTFAIAIMLAASISFITPLEPSCILIYNAGKYRFLDFVKVGTLLTVLLLAVVLLLLPRLWPMHPV